MSQASEIAFMKKLRTISPSSTIVIIVSVITLIYLLVFFVNPPASKYSLEDTRVTGYIYDCLEKEDRVVIKIKGLENLLINYYDDFTCQLGQQIVAKGEMKEPSSSTNFYLFDYKNYLLSNKINYTFTADDIEVLEKEIPLIYKIKNLAFEHTQNYQSREYLEALVLGRDDFIDDTVQSSYQTNGISHLLAISGAQITLFSTLLLTLFNKVFSKKTSYFITLLLLVFYLFITSFQPSILRATIFFILLTINKQFELNIKTLNLLIVTALCLLIYNPYYIYSLGFVLSFTVSFYLILFRKIINKYNNYFSKTLVISIIAFLSSAPIIINSFFELNLLSPIINLYFVPLMTFIIYPLSLVTFVFKPLDLVFLNFISIMENASLKLSNISFLNLTMPHLNILFFLIFYLLITFVLIKWQKGQNYVLVIFFIFFAYHNINYLNPISSLTMIDVGQGDSFLIKLKNNEANILIDTGGQVKWDGTEPYDIAENIIIPYLRAEGIDELDYLIITHGDFDHAGMALNLIQNFKIKHIILNKENNELEEEIVKSFNGSVTNISEGTLKIKNTTFKFLNGLNNHNENDDSLIIYTNIESRNILLMGDASAASEEYILNEYNLPKMDILKVGHHGSKTSTSSEFVEVISPKISLISAGKNNMYGHPHQETLEKLKQSQVLITQKDGAVKINLNDLTILTKAR